LLLKLSVYLQINFIFRVSFRINFAFLQNGGNFALQKAIAGDSVWASPI